MPRLTPLLLAIVAFDLLMIGAFLTAWYAFWLPFQAGIAQFLNPDQEVNLPTWYVTAKLLTGALLCLLAAAASGFRTFTPVLLAVILALMSLDEAAQLHDRIGLALSITLFEQGIVLEETTSHDWPYLVGIPAIVVLAILLWLAARERTLTGRSLAGMVAGLGLFLAGAVGLEILSHVVIWTEADLWFTRPPLLTTAEETLEILGASFLLWASAGVVFDHRIAVAALFAEWRR